jgi:hypothetical protein
VSCRLQAEKQRVRGWISNWRQRTGSMDEDDQGSERLTDGQTGDRAGPAAPAAAPVAGTAQAEAAALTAESLEGGLRMSTLAICKVRGLFTPTCVPLAWLGVESINAAVR